MSTKKKKHHYVWQHYLTAWARDGEQVWCLRKGGEPFRSHTLNIGQQRYFYRLREMSQLNNKGSMFASEQFAALLALRGKPFSTEYAGIFSHGPGPTKTTLYSVSFGI